MRKLSLKYRILLIVLAVQVPFIFLFRTYTNRVVDNMNLQLSIGYSNSLRVFCAALENEMRNTDVFLAVDCWGNENFRKLSMISTESESEGLLTDLVENTQILMDNNSNIRSVIFTVPDKGMIYPLFNDSTKDLDERILIEELFADGQFCKEAGNGWKTEESKGRIYIIRTINYGAAYCSVVVDLKKVAETAITIYNMSAPIVFLQNDTKITEGFWSRNYEGNLLDWGKEEKYRIIENGKREYMVVKDKVLALSVLYGVPYNYNWNWMNVMVYGFVTVMIISLGITFLSLKYSFFNPLSRLLSVMNSIRKGNLNIRSTDFTSKEFSYINETFNEMVDMIAELKIETYENQIKAKTAQMDTLRLQIRRHFFLNCMKDIYAMSTLGDINNIQQMILLLSDHLRYTLDISQNVVSLSKELEMCNNYMELQRIGHKSKPECFIKIDKKLREFSVPPISILTLVENCCKYGATQEKALIVSIQVKLQSMDEKNYVTFIVSDNGPGFSEEILRELNFDSSRMKQVGHIGIINLIGRFKMYYGVDCSFLFHNDNGANIEIVIPLGE